MVQQGVNPAPGRMLSHFKIVWRLVYGLLTAGQTILSMTMLIAVSLFIFACVAVESLGIKQVAERTCESCSEEFAEFILSLPVMTKICITSISLQAHCQRSRTQSTSHHWPSCYTQFFGPEPVFADALAICDAGRYCGCLLPTGLGATLSLCILLSNFDLHIHWAHESCYRCAGGK